MKPIYLLSIALLLLASCQSKPKQQDTPAETTTMPDSAASLAKRPGPDSPRSAADRVVRALYFEHQKTENPFRATDPALVEQFFTKPVAALILEAKPAVKKDLLFNAPDKRVAKTWVEPAATGGSRAVVYTTFEENGAKKEIRLEMKQIDGRWRIDDMTYPDNTQLKQLLNKK